MFLAQRQFVFGRKEINTQKMQKNSKSHYYCLYRSKYKVQGDAKESIVDLETSGGVTLESGDMTVRMLHRKM
jgi:hypothetical protein